MIGSKLKSAAAALLFIISCASCDGGDGKNATIKTVIDENPVTLDPQTALNDSSVGIIANVFSGLFAYDEGGRIVPEMAETYTVSDDGLVWDFKLKENVMWYDGEDFSAPCTANDYVFAFRRLIDPAAKSKRAAEYFCIKNAERLNNKVITDITMLGVEALDDYRLRITLEEPRLDFRTMLAAAPAMPCNEEYFSRTEGRYGLSEDCLASNGSFYLYSWRYDKWSTEGNYIVLRRNKLNNTEENEICPYGMTFFIGMDGCDALKKGDIQCYVTDNEDEQNKLSSFSHNEYESGNYGLVFNCGGIFGNNSLRTALGISAKRQLSSGDRSMSHALIPDSVMIGDRNYRYEAGLPDEQEILYSDLSDRYIKAVYEVGADKINGLRLIMPKNRVLRELVSSVLQGWQKDYGFFCGISEYDDPEYFSALRNGDFDIAVVKLNGDSAAAYFDSFSSDSSVGFYGISNKKLTHILKSIYTSFDAEKALMYCKEAEQTVLDMCYFVPICFGSESVYYSKGVSGVKYVPYNGALLFKSALRE